MTKTDTYLVEPLANLDAAAAGPYALVESAEERRLVRSRPGLRHTGRRLCPRRCLR